MNGHTKHQAVINDFRLLIVNCKFFWAKNQIPQNYYLLAHLLASTLRCEILAYLQYLHPKVL